MAKRIVFLGDSLTEGQDGASYLALLRERAARLPSLRDVEMLNAGVGGDTVVNLARRLTADVVSQAPDAVVIFVGVNDFTMWWLRHSLPTTNTPHLWRYFRREKHIDGSISPARFADGLRALVDQLSLRTSARVTLCTPATHGESAHSPARRALGCYAEAVRMVAGERGCGLIDLYPLFTAALADLPPRPLGVRLASPYMKGDDYEVLARRRGYMLTYDGVHFTARGAALVADAMLPALAVMVTESAPSQPSGL